MSAYDEEFDGAIGIDLGTTYSCVAVFHNDRVEVIPNNQGNRTTPSCVAFYHDEVLVGDSAKNLAARGVPDVLYDAKRMIGARYDDATLQSDMKHWPFKVRRGRHDKVEVEVRFRNETLYLAPEQISAKVLSYLKECAERYLGKQVKKAVVTVPAYFNDSQRQATKDAGMIAGLDVLRIINEPTAAALCYGLGMLPNTQSAAAAAAASNSNRNDTRGVEAHSASESKALNIVVFDLGGGTFDVTVVTVDSGTFAVRATAGDTHLGGQDIDVNLLQHLCDDIQSHYGVSLEANPRWLAKARAACERVKRVLSFAMSEELTLEGVLPNDDDYTLLLSRAKLEELNAPVLERCRAVVQRALKDAALSPAEADAVILVGGSSRIPRVQSMLRQLFPACPLSNSVHPDEAVAIGAAVQASILYDSLRSGDAGDGCGSVFPTELNAVPNTTTTTTTTTTTAADAVTRGNHRRNARTAGVLLMDVLPLSIGVEVDDGRFDVIIPRNTTIPYKATKEYSTVEHNQRNVDIVVYEGERPRTRHNHKLGAFSLEGIDPAPQGEPTICVTFSVDADGVLTITAAEEKTGGLSRTLVVQNDERLSAAEVAEMVATAERLARQDRAHVERRARRAVTNGDEDDNGDSGAEAAGHRRRGRTTTTSKRRRSDSCTTANTTDNYSNDDISDSINFGGNGIANNNASDSSCIGNTDNKSNVPPSASSRVQNGSGGGEGDKIHAEAAQKLQSLLHRLEKALQRSEGAETEVVIPAEARRACSKLFQNGQEWVTRRLTTYTNAEELERKVHKIQKRLHRAIRIAEGGGGHAADDGSDNENENEERNAAEEVTVRKVLSSAEADREGGREGHSSASAREASNNSSGSNHEAAAPGTSMLCQTDIHLG